MNKQIHPYKLNDKELQEAIATLRGFVNLRRWKGNLYGGTEKYPSSNWVIPRYSRDPGAAMMLFQDMPGCTLTYKDDKWMLTLPDGRWQEHFNLARLISSAWYWEHLGEQS